MTPEESVFDHSHLSFTENMVNDPAIFDDQDNFNYPYKNGILRLRPGISKWVTTPTLDADITTVKFYKDSAGTAKLLIGASNDLYYANKSGAPADWTLITNGTDVGGGNSGFQETYADFSDNGVPVILYHATDNQAQLRYVNVTTSTAVTSVFGSILGSFDQRAWLSTFSTAGSGGLKDRVFYSDIGDQETFSATSYFQVGTLGYAISKMQEYNENFYIFNTDEMFSWDTYQLKKIYNLGCEYYTNTSAGELPSVAVVGNKLFFSNDLGIFEYAPGAIPKRILEHIDQFSVTRYL